MEPSTASISSIAEISSGWPSATPIMVAGRSSESIRSIFPGSLIRELRFKPRRRCWCSPRKGSVACHAPSIACTGGVFAGENGETSRGRCLSTIGRQHTSTSMRPGWRGLRTPRPTWVLSCLFWTMDGSVVATTIVPPWATGSWTGGSCQTVSRTLLPASTRKDSRSAYGLNRR